MMDQSYMLTHLFHNTQNTQLHKQKGESSSGDSGSSTNK